MGKPFHLTARVSRFIGERRNSTIRASGRNLQAGNSPHLPFGSEDWRVFGAIRKVELKRLRFMGVSRCRFADF
jgi:hypothetical protein